MNTMTDRKKLALSLIGSAVTLGLIFLTGGCVLVPKTTISGSIGGQPFSLTSPKDYQLSGFEIIASTNGSATIKIQSLSADMNPAVIHTTAAGQSAIIQGVTQAVQAGVQAGLSAAGAAAGVPAKP